MARPPIPDPTPERNTPRSRGRLARALTLVALAAGTIAAFAGVRANGWILLDDPRYVTDNVHVRAGLTWDGLRWCLTTPHGGNWHPLTSVSHMLDVQLFELAAEAHHLVNLGWHVLTVLLLAVALARLTGSWWKSALVAALFAWHPLRVESVAWVAERKDVLSGFGFALTLLAYARWCERPTRGRGAALFGAGLFGLMAKPMLVTLPCVLLLLDVWPLRRLALERAALRDGTLRARLIEKLPLFAAALFVVAATLATQSRTGAMTHLAGLSLAARASNALVSYVRYAGALAWPVDLAVLYPHPRTVQLGAALGSAALLAGVSLAAWSQRARRPWLLVGWLWYVGMLVPVIGLVQVGRQGWADRYTYLPCIGLLIALVWSVADATARAPRVRAALLALTGVVLVVLGVLTTRQVARWKDSVTLFEWTVRVTRDNPFAELGLGGALAQAGRLSEAVPHLARAVALEPADEAARDRLVTALWRLGRIAEARDALARGLALTPNALRYTRLGELFARDGRDTEAVAAFESALALEPTSVLAHAGAARALDRMEQSAASLAHYRAWLAVRPDDREALVGAAWLLSAAPEDSVRDGREAVGLADRARARSKAPVAIVEAVAAAAHAEAGEFGPAITAAESALAIARRERSNDEAALYAQQLARYRAGRAYRLR